MGLTWRFPSRSSIYYAAFRTNIILANFFVILMTMPGVPGMVISINFGEACISHTIRIIGWLIQASSIKLMRGFSS